MRKPFYLVPVIATMLVACESSNQVEVGRDQYRSKEDCVQEWSEQQCETFVDNYRDDDDGITYADTYYYGPEFPPRWIGPNGIEYGGRQSMAGFHGNPGALRGVSSLTGRPGALSGAHMSSSIRGGFGGMAMGHAGS